MVQANIRGNYFHNCMNNLGLMSSNFSSANVTVTDNTFVGGSMSLDNSAYRVMLAENHYHNPTFIALGDNCSFVNNYVIYTTTLPTVPIFNIKKAVGCTFKAMSETTEITFKSYRFDGCTFEKLTLRAEPINTKVREATVFKDCDIISCSFRNHIFSGAPVKVTVSDSKVVDTTFEVGITNTDNQNPYVSLEDCDVKITTKDKLFISDTNRAYATCRAVRCEVEIANPSFGYLIYSSGSKVNYVYLKDNNFAYTGAVTPLALKYYVNKSHIKEFVSTGNRFDNITLPVADAGVFKGYDPENSDVAEPSYGYYSLGKIIYTATPVAGGTLGWICVQEGVATNVNWTASTAYLKGDLVASGTKVYECVLGGTSSTTAPTQTTGKITEGTVTWKYAGTKPVFKQIGLISN